MFEALHLIDTKERRSAENTVIVCKCVNVLVGISIATTQTLQLDYSLVDCESYYNAFKEYLVLFHRRLGDLFPGLDLSIDDWVIKHTRSVC